MEEKENNQKEQNKSTKTEGAQQKQSKIVSWRHIGDFLYGETADGKDDILITDRYIEVLGKVEKVENHNIFETRRVIIKNNDKVKKEITIPFEDFKNQKKCFEYLTSSGFTLARSNVKIYEYLISSSTSKLPLTRTINKLGFQENGDYVCPSFSIGSAITYRLNDKDIPNNKLIDIVNLNKSKTMIEALSDNAIYVFCICYALSCALLRFSKININPIFNFFGSTSLGKTILLSLVSSITGYQKNEWRSTTNALEGTAESCNDGVFIIDELGQFKDANMKEALYTLTNGRGKSRSTKSGNNAITKTWREMCVSAGEEMIHDKIENVSGGAEVRGIDINADYESKGRIITSFLRDGKTIDDHNEVEAFVEELKSFNEKDNSCIFQKFVQFLFENSEALSRNEDLRQLLDKEFKKCRKELFKEFNLLDADNKLQRISDYFAFVYAVGLLALKSEALPFTEEQIKEAVFVLFRQYVERFATTISIADQILEYLMSNPSRFKEFCERERKDGSIFEYNDKERETFNGIWGYRVVREKQINPAQQKVQSVDFYIQQETFKALCAKFGRPELVKEELVKEGVLFLDNKGRPKQIPVYLMNAIKAPKPIRCYQLRFENEQLNL